MVGGKPEEDVLYWQKRSEHEAGSSRKTVKSRCSSSSPLPTSVGMDCPQGAQPSSGMTTVPTAPEVPQIQSSIMNAGREGGLSLLCDSPPHPVTDGE